MDIAMPGMNGVEAAERMMKQWPSVRLIILSMYTNEDYIRQALSAGAAGYLQKGPIGRIGTRDESGDAGRDVSHPAVSKQVVTIIWNRRRKSPAASMS